MPRARTIPDTEVFAVVRSLMASGTDRAATFAAVARAVGLSPASLAQRYATVGGMAQAALADGWSLLSVALAQADAEAAEDPDGAVAILRVLSADGAGSGPRLLAMWLDDPALATLAAAWQEAVEAALARRLGPPGAPDPDAAAILFAAWQGRMIWATTGRKGARLKLAARRLAGTEGRLGKSGGKGKGKRKPEAEH
jgi:AcrR family transcriptional regulator